MAASLDIHVANDTRRQRRALSLSAIPCRQTRPGDNTLRSRTTGGRNHAEPGAAITLQCHSSTRLEESNGTGVQRL